MPLIDLSALTDSLITHAPTAAAPPPGGAPPRTDARPLPPLPGDTFRALRERTAVRSWGADPLDGGLLRRALAHACEGDHLTWRTAFPHAPAPTAAVLVQRVSGVEPGHYHYDPHGDVLVAPTPSLPALEGLVLQLEFAQAPALIVVQGDLSGAVARDGISGHRLLLTRGAAFAHAIWLAALSEGGAGTVFAGVLGAAGRTELGIDGGARTQLLGLALGMPAVSPGAAPHPEAVGEMR